MIIMLYHAVCMACCAINASATEDICLLKLVEKHAIRYLTLFCYRGHLLVEARRKARHQVSNFVLHRKARKLKDMEG